LLNTGDQTHFSDNGLLTTVAFKHLGKPCYALEGSSYIAGAAVQWLRDNLNIIDNSFEIEALARKVEDLSEVEFLQFFPFFTGIGSPFWNPNAKGAIIGLTRDTKNEHLARVCLEGIALSVNDSITALSKDLDYEISEIRVDGGASLNDLLMEIQASFSDKKIIRPKIIETTAYGVCIGSLIGIDLINFEQLSTLWKIDKEFLPKSNDYFDNKKSMWLNYIKKNFS
jgi:glycerol kinase